MTVQLNRTDFQRLAHIVQELPDFANVRDRRRLVAGALAGVARADIILARLDLDGTPMSVAVEVVRFLAQFGQVAYGKEALGVFLNYIQPFVGDDDAAFIAGLFHTNADLDFTVVQLDNPPDYGALTLQPVQVRKDQRVAIIQHPGGHLKQISMQNNFVAYADGRVVQYTTSTLPGSSGSPVFNEEFAVVAIHHSGGLLLEPGTERRYLTNAGTSMIAVVDDLKSNAPAIYARLGA